MIPQIVWMAGADGRPSMGATGTVEDSIDTTWPTKTASALQAAPQGVPDPLQVHASTGEGQRPAAPNASITRTARTVIGRGRMPKQTQYLFNYTRRTGDFHTQLCAADGCVS